MPALVLVVLVVMVVAVEMMPVVVLVVTFVGNTISCKCDEGQRILEVAGDIEGIWVLDAIVDWK